MANDNRVTLTIKLTPGKDNDLIEWFQSLPKGDYNSNGDGRQTTLKNALRRSIGSDPTPTRQQALEPLFEELQYLRGMVEQRSSGGGDSDRINAIETELSKAIEWINYLNRQVEGLTLPGGSPAVEPTVEPAAQMSETELSKRAGKLKKAAW